MNVAPHILNELKEISEILGSIPTKAELVVPEGYFDALAEMIHLRKNADGTYKESLNLPENYFENLPQQILNRIQQEEGQEAHFPLLSRIKKDNIFSVPPGYFEKNPQTILEKCRAEKSAKIISFSKKVWSLSAAAVIIILLTLGIFNFNILGNKDRFSMAAKYKTEEQVLNGIDRLKADEIVSYLETHGNVTDNAFLISNDEANELPTTEDYLFNDNVLQEYLKSIGGIEAN